MAIVAFAIQIVYIDVSNTFSQIVHATATCILAMPLFIKVGMVCMTLISNSKNVMVNYRFLVWFSFNYHETTSNQI
jgi:hypothetical protein